MTIPKRFKEHFTNLGWCYCAFKEYVIFYLGGEILFFKPLNRTNWTDQSFVEECLQAPKILSGDEKQSWKRVIGVQGKIKKDC